MKITSPGRIEVIDVLRGFALMGILLVHASGEFAGWSSTYNSPVRAESLSTSSLDSAVNFLMNLLLINKSRALFAFLFGVGFYFQLGKASRNGYRIEGRFAKRMLMLFVIGVLHAYLLWSGDILRMYAACGLLLLLVHKWKPESLFITAFICSVLVLALSSALHIYFPAHVLTDGAKADMYYGYAGESYTGLLNANFIRDKSINLDPYTASNYLIPIWGNFLFGYWAAQTNLIGKLISDKSFLIRCLVISGVTGMISSNSAERLVLKLFHSEESRIDVAWRSVLTLPAAYSIEATAFFLLCVVIYLYEYTPAKKWLSFFTYAGRMTLTNYIMQSLFAIVFFYGVGFGFISRYGAFISLCFGLVFFAVQLMYSYLWLSYFTIGPVEFIWRSMIEGKWQSIRKRAVGYQV